VRLYFDLNGFGDTIFPEVFRGKFFAALIEGRVNVFYNFKFIAELTVYMFFYEDSTEFFTNEKRIFCLVKYFKISDNNLPVAEYRQISAISKML